MSDVNLRSYSDISYHNGQSKPLTWLANILFPKLEKLVPTLHIAPKSALLPKFPSDTDVASTHLTKLSHLLQGASSGHPEKILPFFSAKRKVFPVRIIYQFPNSHTTR